MRSCSASPRCSPAALRSPRPRRLRRRALPRLRERIATRNTSERYRIKLNAIAVRLELTIEASREEAPVILDEYANTSSAGSIIAFHKYRDDLAEGALGVICAFGAGYSAGSIVVRRAA